MPATAIAAQAGAAPDQNPLRDRTVDALTRLSLSRLRAAPNPSRSDYEAAARSLGIVRAMAPTDTDLLRRQLEAWAASGDSDAEIACTRELLALDPSDTYTQLRVILSGLTRLQNADNRLSAYAKLLGDRARAIDPSVRSRLALDAALLARDNGDDKQYLEYLTLATTLDPTNKEAAALFASNLLQLTSDPAEHVDILANVILADPLDPSAYDNLALELLQYGAFQGALRVMRISADINAALGRDLDENGIFDFALCEWNVYGPEVAITRLAIVLRDTMLAEDNRRRALEADGKPPGDRHEMLLPPRLQLLRLAIAISATGDAAFQTPEPPKPKPAPKAQAPKPAEAAKPGEAPAPEEAPPEDAGVTAENAIGQVNTPVSRILDDFTKGNTRAIEELTKQIEPSEQELLRATANAAMAPLRMENPIAQYNAAIGLRNARGQVQVFELQRLWAQLASGLDRDLAEAYIVDLEAARKRADEFGKDDLSQPAALAPEVLQRYRGWLLAIKGEYAEADKLLTPLVDTDILARWALASQKEQQGLVDEAVKHYAILARDQPTTALGSAAFFRLKALLKKPIVRSAVAADLDRRVLAMAPWLEDETKDPSRYMSARIDVTPREIRTFDRPVIRIEIRNTSRWPLGVGTQRPIPKRMLLAPRVRVDGRDMSASTAPLVALISSRIRLESGASVFVDVHPLREDFGRLLDNSACKRVDARWQMLQNFVTDQGGFKASPLTITAQSDVLVRVPLDANVTIDDLVDRIGKDVDQPFINDLLVAGDLILTRSNKKAQEDPTQAQERTTLVSAIIARIPELPELERTLAIIRCSELGFAGEESLSTALNGALATESAPLPLLAAINGLAWTSDSPLLTRAEQSTDPEVARIATLLRESLDTQKKEAEEEAAQPPPTPAPAPDDAAEAPTTDTQEPAPDPASAPAPKRKGKGAHPSSPPR